MRSVINQWLYRERNAMLRYQNTESRVNMASSSKVLLAMMLAVVLTKAAYATKHVVGGSQGWDESSDFNSWASAQTFKVGDQIVFKYTPSLHSVVELSGSTAFKNCDIGTALDPKTTGNDVIKLTNPGTRYFACGTMGHCDRGMKLKITTVAAAAAAADDTSPSSPTSDTDSSPPSSSSSTSTTMASTSASASHIISMLWTLAVLVAVLANSLIKA